MPVEYENHQGVKIPVGSEYPEGKMTIIPSQDRWPGAKPGKGELRNGRSSNGNGAGKK